MKFTLRILIGYFLIVGLTAWFVLNIFMQEVKPSVRESLEDTLVDVAYLLADIAQPELLAIQTQAHHTPTANSTEALSHTLRQGALAAAVARYRQRSVDIKIWELRKRQLELGIYLTDPQGRVLFSSDPQEIGRDYSRWNDVLRTLRGEYGARASRTDPADDGSVVMYVAAPIMQGEQRLGVLTVAKSVRSVEPIIERAQRKIAQHGLLLLGLSLTLGLAFTAWVTLRINRLRRYAQAVARGERVSLPAVGHTEIADLGEALESMRTQLEGKAYVERYVEGLTHELKSPLTAIRAAAECLQQPVNDAQRQHFAQQIQAQAERLHKTIDTQLSLAHLERQAHLLQNQPVALNTLLEHVLQHHRALAEQRGITLHYQAPSQTLTTRGDAELLTQAISSLLSNALDFSSPQNGATIFITLAEHTEPSQACAKITVRDQGSGIPTFALPRIFERYYSLPRANGQKSTGLGLSLVKEIAELHQGTIHIENHPDGGVLATLRLPLPANLLPTNR